MTNRIRLDVREHEILPFDEAWCGIVCDACLSSNPTISFQPALITRGDQPASTHCLLWIDCSACQREIAAMWPAYYHKPHGLADPPAGEAAA